MSSFMNPKAMVMIKMALFVPVAWVAMTWPEMWTAMIVLGGGSIACLTAAGMRRGQVPARP